MTPVESTARRAVPSGRPGPGEYADAQAADIDELPGDDVVGVLERTREEVRRAFGRFEDAAVAGVRYAPGKWTIKDILQHLVDDERSYAVRALAIARGDERPQPGFDENLWARHARAEERPVAALLAEYEAVRASTLAMFASLPAKAWERRGVSNGDPVTVRGLGFQIAGHEWHHVRIVRERYLPLLGEIRG